MDSTRDPDAQSGSGLHTTAEPTRAGRRGTVQGPVPAPRLADLPGPRPTATWQEGDLPGSGRFGVQPALSGADELERLRVGGVHVVNDQQHRVVTGHECLRRRLEESQVGPRVQRSAVPKARSRLLRLLGSWLSHAPWMSDVWARCCRWTGAVGLGLTEGGRPARGTGFASTSFASPTPTLGSTENPSPAVAAPALSLMNGFELFVTLPA